jgi:hypothetical protein
VTSPPPYFWKVCDLNGDEVGCFERDLEVLIPERLQSEEDWSWALLEK